MSRLFTFGCSFTKYYYPTWADILGQTFTESYNCGKLGSGNQLIAHRVMDANLQKKFTKDDTIIIMWSNFFRNDLYKEQDWQTKGNIFFYDNTIQTEDLPYWIYRDCTTIKSILLALKNTGAKVISTSINDPYKDKTLLQYDKVKHILEMFKEYVTPQTITIQEHCWYPNIEKDKTRPQVLINGLWTIEDHPLPLEHLNWLEEALDFSTDVQTQEFVQDAHKRIMENKNYDTIFEAGRTIKWTL